MVNKTSPKNVVKKYLQKIFIGVCQFKKGSIQSEK